MKDKVGRKQNPSQAFCSQRPTSTWKPDKIASAHISFSDQELLGNWSRSAKSWSSWSSDSANNFEFYAIKKEAENGKTEKFALFAELTLSFTPNIMLSNCSNLCKTFAT